jgi:hypothetical protein
LFLFYVGLNENNVRRDFQQSLIFKLPFAKQLHGSVIIFDHAKWLILIHFMLFDGLNEQLLILMQNILLEFKLILLQQ